MFYDLCCILYLYERCDIITICQLNKLSHLFKYLTNNYVKRLKSAHLLNIQFKYSCLNCTYAILQDNQIKYILKLKTIIGCLEEYFYKNNVVKTIDLLKPYTRGNILVKRREFISPAFLQAMGHAHKPDYSLRFREIHYNMGSL